MKRSPLGVYVHIPYCLQRCVYCDFATYELSQVPPPDQYINLLCREIEHNSWSLLASGRQDLKTVYFGGGTPSLLEPSYIVAILQRMRSIGFKFTPDIEITIEINPATVSEKKLDEYMEGG